MPTQLLAYHTIFDSFDNTRAPYDIWLTWLDTRRASIWDIVNWNTGIWYSKPPTVSVSYEAANVGWHYQNAGLNVRQTTVWYCFVFIVLYGTVELLTIMINSGGPLLLCSFSRKNVDVVGVVLTEKMMKLLVMNLLIFQKQKRHSVARARPRSGPISRRAPRANETPEPFSNKRCVCVYVFFLCVFFSFKIRYQYILLGKNGRSSSWSYGSYGHHDSINSAIM